MTESEAVKIAMLQRDPFNVPHDFTARFFEKRIIELVFDGQPVADKLPGPGPVRDTVAWVVKLGSGISEVEFAIDDMTGQVVRFRRSRSAVGLVPFSGGGNESNG